MTLNRHGHHIVGTISDNEPAYHEVVLCDGVAACDSCIDDSEVFG